jgi:hypothetical protein
LKVTKHQIRNPNSQFRNLLFVFPLSFCHNVATEAQFQL